MLAIYQHENLFYLPREWISLFKILGILSNGHYPYRNILYGTYKGKLYGKYMSLIYISYMSCIWILNTMRCKSQMCLICIWQVYGSYKASTVNSYNPLIWHLQQTYKSLPYVPGIYLFCDKMHVYNRQPLQLNNHILDKVNPDLIHLAVKCKTYITD